MQEAIKAVPSSAKKIDDFIPHKRMVEKALSEGKPVPTKVLKDYPLSRRRALLFAELKRKKKTRKTKPLPPEAENVQTILFDSKEYTCYGKPVGEKSYRVYCRKNSHGEYL